MSFLPALVLLLAPAVQSSASAPRHETARVEGTIVLHEADGARRTPTTGWIRFWQGARGGHEFRAEVRDGRFATELPLGATGWLDVGEIELDGAACFAVLEPPFQMPSNPLVLVALRVRPATVRFVAAEEGVDLTRVTLVAPGSDPERSVLVSSPHAVQLFGGVDDFPRGWIGQREYVVSAPGRARRHVWIDPSDGGTRTFELEREARLEIRADLVSHWPDARRVELSREGDTWLPAQRDVGFEPGVVTDPEQRGRSYRVARADGLAAGTWHVRFVDADGPSDELARIELAVGESRVVDLRPPGRRSLDPLPHDPDAANEGASPRVALRGTLRLPPDARREDLVLRFARGGDVSTHAPSVEPLGPELLVPDRVDARLLHWYAGRVPLGTWIATVEALGLRAELRVRDDAPHALSLDPAPAPTPAAAALEPPRSKPVRVRFVERAGSAPLARSSLDVRGFDGAAWTTCADDGVTWTVFDAREPARVSVARRDEPYADDVVELGPSDDVQTVVLREILGIRVTAYEGDARIAAPEIAASLSPRAVALGHGGTSSRVRATRTARGTVVIPVDAPGRYRVRLGPSEGYAPHPAVEVEVRAGGPAPEAVFRLTRAPRER